MGAYSHRVAMVDCIGGCHVDVKATVDGPVVMGTSNPVRVRRTSGGVACNVARWLARLGIPVTLHSMVGDDEAGRGLIDRLGGEGVGVEGIDVVPGASTAIYTALLDPDGGLVLGIADMGIYDRMDAGWAEGILGRLDSSLLLADANLTEAAIATIARGKQGRRLVADPVSVSKATRMAPWLDRIDAVFPDGGEAAALSGRDAPRAAAETLVRAGANVVVVTLGAGGVVVADESGSILRPVVTPRRIVDVTGAGDALVAGYLFGLAAGEADPVGWGLAAASLAVETVDTVPESVTRDLVRSRLPR